MFLRVVTVWPVAVGGPITKIIDGFAADFEKENPRLKVKPIYAGTYQESIAKALTAHKSGTAPVTSVLLSTDMFSLIDEDAIVAFDDFARGESDRKWLNSFFPAFMANSQTGGKTWGIPFQRSTIVLYYNKEMFKDAGLDPSKPPATAAVPSRKRRLCMIAPPLWLVFTVDVRRDAPMTNRTSGCRSHASRDAEHPPARRRSGRQYGP